MITRFTTDGKITRDFSQVSINSIESEFRVQFDTKEERDLFVAQFPKSTKVRTWDGSEFDAFIWVTSTKTWYGATNEVTGSTNEQGMKRLTKFYKAIQSHLAK